MDDVFAGMVLGLMVAAPVGPTGTMCIQRALEGGFRSGFAAGLGAATVHAAYAALAALGTVLLGALAPPHSRAVGLVAAALLLLSGCRTLRRGGVRAAPAMARTALLGCYSAAAVLTLCNPVTASLFATMVPALTMDPAAPRGAAPLAVGIFIGSALWWLALSAGVSVARRRFSAAGVRRINGLCGLSMIGFALLLIGRQVG
ncbi:LysE family translocator [Azospirillum sp. ST 5-10]|uniref:LysE family translocator n=1 Tax=unclassified Azospirillum TaxID=2630922 RepID=UPI003F4A149A